MWLDLALLDSSLVTLLIHASGSMESRRALLVTLVPILHVAAEEGVFPSEVTPVP